MLTALDLYLSHASNGALLTYGTLGALTPGFLMVLGGFAWAHVSDYRGAR